MIRTGNPPRHYVRTLKIIREKLLLNLALIEVDGSTIRTCQYIYIRTGEVKRSVSQL